MVLKIKTKMSEEKFWQERSVCFTGDGAEMRGRPEQVV